MRVLCAALVVLAGPVMAAQKIPMSAAIAQCETRSLRYARAISDGGANTPSDQKIEDHFRSCVYAKSGQYPPRKPLKPGLRLSGSAAIGIVVQD